MAVLIKKACLIVLFLAMVFNFFLKKTTLHLKLCNYTA